VASTVVISLAAWMGSNAAFLAIRLYVTLDWSPYAEVDPARYPRLVN
jgi:hypothetical protein